MAYVTLPMLTSTQMEILCVCCNHSSKCLQILNLRNFQGPPPIIHPLYFSLPNVLKLWMALEKHGYPALGYTSSRIPLTRNHLL